MYGTLDVHSRVGIRAGRDMTYCVNTDDVDIMLSDGTRRFDLAIEIAALQKLLEVGSSALDARGTGEAAAGRPPARLESIEVTERAA